MIPIPDQLIDLASQRRLIPFVGAGFSTTLGFPNWENLLRSLCSACEGAVDFDDVLASTNNDLLQVAEYLYVKHDRQIGPIRHHIEKSFAQSNVHPLTSGAHVELVNLGAGQIYTTNYDDAIERTYRELGMEVDPVILPKDVALANTERTQIVKYHGDLAHERTLVLTESAYYQRLDFESPMDLKFRSDLLGKSVLFMGYSFRDINIRIIWFKLMQMMRDIPERDRHPSYILMLQPDPVLEDLYAAVGLRTIVLSPDAPLETPAEKASALARFLMDLAQRANTSPLRGTPGRGEPLSFVSAAALDALEPSIESLQDFRKRAKVPVRYLRRSGFLMDHELPFNRLIHGEVPEPLRPRWASEVTRLLPALPATTSTAEVLSKLGPSNALTEYVVDALSATGDADARLFKEALVSSKPLWRHAWQGKISLDQARTVLEAFRNEIEYQAQRDADYDIAYLGELVTRIAGGNFIIGDTGTKSIERVASQLLASAAAVYPAITGIELSDRSAPQIAPLLAQIDARVADFEPILLDDLPEIPDADDQQSDGNS